MLVHGLASVRYVMSPLAQRIRAGGYQTTNWGYWSIFPGIPDQAAKLERVLDDLVRDARVERLHLVTHSMGSIMARHALSRGIPEKVRRWVMLGAPNRGSRVAKNLARGIGWFCPPLRDLSDDAGSFVSRMNLELPRFSEQLREAGVKVGVIAASHDHMVSLASARLGCEDDFLVARGMHTDILFRPAVHRQVLAFLRGGSFDHQRSFGAACPPTAARHS